MNKDSEHNAVADVASQQLSSSDDSDLQLVEGKLEFKEFQCRATAGEGKATNISKVATRMAVSQFSEPL